MLCFFNLYVRAVLSAGAGAFLPVYSSAGVHAAWRLRSGITMLDCVIPFLLVEIQVKHFLFLRKGPLLFLAVPQPSLIVRQLPCVGLSNTFQHITLLSRLENLLTATRVDV